MNIAHLDEQQGWRGGEQQASWLIQGLAARGHRVWIIGRPQTPFLTDPHGGVTAPRIALPLRGEFDLFSAWRLAQLCRKEGIQIIHAHTSHAHSIAVLARRIAGAGAFKVVASRRVSFPPKGHIFNRWKYAQPDRILCVSYKVAEVMNAFGADASRTAVVHSAVDPARMAVEPLPRSEMDVPEGVPLLVSAGALEDHKDHLNLLEAFARVRRRHPEAWLAIAGGGKLRPMLEARAQALDVSNQVRFLGHRKDAPRIIRAGSLYISSSWSEGLGTSILEALASGTPVVATEAGGAREMVIPEKTGWLVPIRDAEALANAIIDALARPEDARRMAEAGKQLIDEEYTAPRMVARTLREYGALLNETADAAEPGA